MGTFLLSLALGGFTIESHPEPINQSINQSNNQSINLYNTNYTIRRIVAPSRCMFERRATDRPIKLLIKSRNSKKTSDSGDFDFRHSPDVHRDSLFGLLLALLGVENRVGDVGDVAHDYAQ